jgi:hypothetical protein
LKLRKFCCIGRCWFEGSKNEYRKAVVTKHWKVISDFLFGDVVNHKHDAQTDDRFKDGHNKEETKRTAVIGSLPAF